MATTTLALALVATLGGCRRHKDAVDSDDDRAPFTVVDPGSGPTNTLPSPCSPPGPR